uniref:Uncharacterized protein n=1 Tax=Anguilla anguilla TaxID=7936 RepID=A0A0E9R9Y7_ANGAN
MHLQITLKHFTVWQNYTSSSKLTGNILCSNISYLMVISYLSRSLRPVFSFLQSLKGINQGI